MQASGKSLAKLPQAAYLHLYLLTSVTLNSILPYLTPITNSSISPVPFLPAALRSPRISQVQNKEEKNIQSPSYILHPRPTRSLFHYLLCVLTLLFEVDGI